MRKAIIKELRNQNLFLLSYNRYLYVLQNKQEVQKSNSSSFMKMKILKSFVWDNTVMFDVFEKKNMLVIGE